MLLQCTQKLLDELPVDKKATAITSDAPSLLGNWHANLIRIERRKCILFTNDATLFSFFVPKLMKPDFQNLTSVFLDHLISNLTYEGFEQYTDVVAQEYQGNIHFSRTNNRSVLGTMKEMIQIIHIFLHEDGGIEGMNNLELNRALNQILFKANQYSLAIECLRQKLHSYEMLK